MAFSYPNTPVLSKIKIGDSYYYLKDADLRTVVDSFNEDIVKGEIGNVGDENKFVYGKEIKDYVDSAVAVGLVIEVVTELPDADADHMGRIYLIKHEHATKDIYDEYIIVRTGSVGAYSYSWEKIGNTDIDLSAYVTDVKWNNGVLQQQKDGSYTDVHSFGAFADADKGEFTVTDYVTGVDSAKVTAEGSIVKDAANGTQISGSISSITTIDGVGTLPSWNAGSFTANTPTVINTAKFNGGEVAAINSGFFNAGTACSKAADTFDGGALPSIDKTAFNGGSCTFPTLTAASISSKPTATFAKQGLMASVGSGTDAETLILSEATTSTAVTDVTIDGGKLNGGSYTAASIGDGFFSQGSLPSFTEGAFTPGTLPSIDTSKFYGGSVASLGEGFYTAGSAAKYTEGTLSAGTLPTTKSVTPTFTGDKFAFSGSEVDANVTLSKGSKTVEVDPKA